MSSSTCRYANPSARKSADAVRGTCVRIERRRARASRQSFRCRDATASTGGGLLGAVARSRSHQSLGIRSRLGGGTTTSSPSSVAGSGGSSAGCQPGSRSVAANQGRVPERGPGRQQLGRRLVAEMGREVVPAVAGQNQRCAANRHGRNIISDRVLRRKSPAECRAGRQALTVAALRPASAHNRSLPQVLATQSKNHE